MTINVEIFGDETTALGAKADLESQGRRAEIFGPDTVLIVNDHIANQPAAYSKTGTQMWVVVAQ